MECINPATEEVMDRVSCDDRRSIHTKFRRLRREHEKWRRRPVEARSRRVLRLGEVLERRASEFVQLLVREVGTPIGWARQEVNYIGQRIEEFVAGTREALAERTVESGPAMEERVRRVPVGVVAQLSTWNRPLAMGVEVMVPALLAGNVVLYKPSAHAALVGKALVEAMAEAGLDEEKVGLVMGDGTVGDFVLDEPVDGVAYAGCASTGRMIAEKLARRMIPRHIDVGVTEGVYVGEDVNVERAAARAADWAFCGGCCGVDRIYVQESVERKFTEALCRRVNSYDVGDPARRATRVGPLVCARRLDQLEYQIGDAVRKGARLLLGGRALGGRGYFFDPTVLVGVDHRMLVMREQTSGPVICVQRVCDDAEAIHRLADVDDGLRAGVICADRERAAEIFASVDAESVYWWDGDEEDGADGEGAVFDRAMAVTRARTGSARDAIRKFVRPQSWIAASREGATPGRR